MNETDQLEKRISVLEAEMNWSSGTIRKIETDLESLKNGQYLLLEKISNLQAHNDAQFVGVHQEISGVHGKISDMHSEFSGVHGKISDMHSEFSGVHGKISDMHSEFSGVHGKISDMYSEFSGVHGKISDMHSEFSGVHGKISDMHSEFSDLHKTISSQTKWLLTLMSIGIAVVTVVHPIIQRLLQ